jgi:two-component system, response regulator YesN
VTANRPSVLVVDDDRDWRFLLDLHLTAAEGLNLIGTVGDAPSALRILEEAVAQGNSHGPPVVVADVRMPGMSGLELAAELRRNQPHVRIVLFSSYIDDHVLEEAARIGVDEVVSKMQLRDLPAILRSLTTANG